MIDSVRCIESDSASNDSYFENICRHIIQNSHYVLDEVELNFVAENLL